MVDSRKANLGTKHGFRGQKDEHLPVNQDHHYRRLLGQWLPVRQLALTLWDWAFVHPRKPKGPSLYEWSVHSKVWLRSLENLSSRLWYRHHRYLSENAAVLVLGWSRVVEAHPEFHASISKVCDWSGRQHRPVRGSWALMLLLINPTPRESTTQTMRPINSQHQGYSPCGSSWRRNH